MKRLMAVSLILVAAGCGKPKAETNSYLVVEMLQRRGLISWYTNDQREQLRAEVERIIKK